MLQPRTDHAGSRTDQPLDEEIERLGGVVRETAVKGFIRAEETAEPLADAGDPFLGLHHGVIASPPRREALLQVFLQPASEALRRLGKGSGRIIQINQFGLRGPIRPV